MDREKIGPVFDRSTEIAANCSSGTAKVLAGCRAFVCVLVWVSAMATPVAAAAVYVAALNGIDPRQVSALVTNTVYDCSASAQFDRFMNLVPAGTSAGAILISIAPGTYRTRGGNGTGAPKWPLVYGSTNGGFVMKNYWEVAGAGTNSTTIVLEDSNVWNAKGDSVGQNIVFQGPIASGYAGLQIHDLTIDCNAAAVYATGRKPRGTRLSLPGILLYGDNCTVRNVVIQHSCGDIPARWVSEVFAIQIGGFTPAFVGGILVDHCTIKDFYGSGSCSGITPVNCAGTISYNAVYLNGAGGQFSYNTLGLNGVTFSYNYSANAARAFNNDSAFNQCLTLRYNTFDVPSGGKGCVLMSSSTSSAHHNRINILGPKATAFALYGPIHWLDCSRKVVGTTPGAHDWRITGNIITAAGTFAPAWPHSKKHGLIRCNEPRSQTEAHLRALGAESNHPKQRA